MTSKKIEGRENKPHVGLFGRTNVGKSTLLNFIVGSETAIVSPQRGTTTDVVRKSYEIRGFAPVIFIDTAGVDDGSELGRKRMERTIETIAQVDLALLVFQEWGTEEQELVRKFTEASIPFIVVHNIVRGRVDGLRSVPNEIEKYLVEIDALHGADKERDLLLDRIKRALPERSYSEQSMFGGLVAEGDFVMLVCPIDQGAPAGRLILPQVKAIRELLDKHTVVITVQPEEIESVLEMGLRPKLVVTDSQLFEQISKALPKDIELTSFSILLAASKGDYELYKRGLERVDRLKDGDRVLIAESCSHQVSCEDIGRVKIPQWLEEYTGAKLSFDTLTALEPLPKDIKQYALMIQCGGCMVTRSQLQNRIRRVAEQGVAVTNYGMLIRKLKKKR